MSKPTQKYKLEDHVNDWVKAEFDQLKLKSQIGYCTESAILDCAKSVLQGWAKTKGNNHAH